MDSALKSTLPRHKHKQQKLRIMRHTNDLIELLNTLPECIESSESLKHKTHNKTAQQHSPSHQNLIVDNHLWVIGVLINNLSTLQNKQ